MRRASGREGSPIVVGLALATAACAAEPLPPDTGENVILVTLDGVRQQELLGLPDPTMSGGDVAPVFPVLHANVAASGVFYGDCTRFDCMTTANNTGRSLPGYMSIFTGYEQPCYDNQCPRVKVETVLEYVQRLRKLPRGQVAVFASWQKLDRALSQVADDLYLDIGPQPDDDPACIFNAAARQDVCTWEVAMRYLDEHRPRLLYVSLLDADSYGHLREYPAYLAALRRYDGWIDELLRHVREDLGEYGARTTILVSTDHGRGDRDGWFEHNTGLPGSNKVFLAGFGPHVHASRFADGIEHSAADIRPTIEVLFGLPASTCTRCGAPAAEIVGDLLE